MEGQFLKYGLKNNHDSITQKLFSCPFVLKMLKTHVPNCSVLWATVVSLQEKKINSSSQDFVQTLLKNNQYSLPTFWINTHFGFSLWRKGNFLFSKHSETTRKIHKSWPYGRSWKCCSGHCRQTFQMESNSDLHRASVAGSTWKYQRIFTYKIEACSLRLLCHCAVKFGIL